MEIAHCQNGGNGNKLDFRYYEENLKFFILNSGSGNGGKVLKSVKLTARWRFSTLDHEVQ